MLAYIYPIDSQATPPVPGTPPRPSNPITLPSLPGIWPKPGMPNLPVDPGFSLPEFVAGHPANPIVLPDDPEHPIQLPPGSIWPPLPPTTSGKYAILIWVIGVGTRWLVLDAGEVARPK